MLEYYMIINKLSWLDDRKDLIVSSFTPVCYGQMGGSYNHKEYKKISF